MEGLGAFLLCRLGHLRLCVAVLIHRPVPPRPAVVETISPSCTQHHDHLHRLELPALSECPQSSTRSRRGSPGAAQVPKVLTKSTYSTVSKATSWRNTFDGHRINHPHHRSQTNPRENNMYIHPYLRFLFLFDNIPARRRGVFGSAFHVHAREGGKGLRDLLLRPDSL